MNQSLPINRYTLTIRALQPLRLPDYAGSMLRGAFGHALRRVACMTRLKTCAGCPLLATCPYTQIFETPPPAAHPLQKFSAMPNPYVIEPPPWGVRVLTAGEEFSFSLVLMGRALPQLPLIILAWERALADGLDKTRSRCQLVSVHAEGDNDPIYQPGGRVRPHSTFAAQAPALGEVVELHFTTPLRLQQKGKPVGLRELDARTLLITLARRHQLLCDSQLDNPPQTDFAAMDSAARQITLSADLRWRDWTRYSSRQQQAMTLGGMVGRVRLAGNLAPFGNLLHIGQWLHLGKEAVFGMGGYQLRQPVATTEAATLSSTPALALTAAMNGASVN